jgi:sigma-B regulation protein RsbU (phosphoserine phosphatase)
LCLIVLDPASGHATFCNAGHPAPILMRADESVERLDAGGMLAGVFADAGYESGCTTIAAGDRLLLFTDGLLEATDASGGEFGDTGLVEAMRLRPGIDAAGLVAAVFDDVRQWSCGPLGDDATALALTVERTWTAASHNRTGPADPAAEAGANTAKTGPTPPENVAQALSLETRRHA